MSVRQSSMKLTIIAWGPSSTVQKKRSELLKFSDIYLVHLRETVETVCGFLRKCYWRSTFRNALNNNFTLKYA